jgi:hypothetical protein
VVEYQLDGYSFWEGELVCSSHAYHVIIINYILNLNPTRGLGLRRPPPPSPPPLRAGPDEHSPSPAARLPTQTFSLALPSQPGSGEARTAINFNKVFFLLK